MTHIDYIQCPHCKKDIPIKNIWINKGIMKIPCYSCGKEGYHIINVKIDIHSYQVWNPK